MPTTDVPPLHLAERNGWFDAEGLAVDTVTVLVFAAISQSTPTLSSRRDDPQQQSINLHDGSRLGPGLGPAVDGVDAVDGKPRADRTQPRVMRTGNPVSQSLYGTSSRSLSRVRMETKHR